MGTVIEKAAHMVTDHAVPSIMAEITAQSDDGVVVSRKHLGVFVLKLVLVAAFFVPALALVYMQMFSLPTEASTLGMFWFFTRLTATTVLAVALAGVALLCSAAAHYDSTHALQGESGDR